MALFSRKHAAPDLEIHEPDALRVLNRSPRAARSLHEETDPEAPHDPADAAKTRARRRLVGAVALALGAVVFVPMLFDATPPLAPDDIAVQIPDRDTPFNPQRPDVTGAPASRVSRGGAEAPAPTPSPVTAPAVAVATDKPSTEREAPANTSGTTPPQDKPKPQASASAEKTPGAASAATRVERDDPRATAALQGKSENADAARAPVEVAATSQRFAVQIAAFSIADKAANLRDRLNANGLKSYTEPLSTPQGERTRVRLGPFTSREAAERARQKLKTMKLDGSVVPL